MNIDGQFVCNRVMPMIMFTDNTKAWYSAQDIFCQILDQRLEQILQQKVPFINLLKDDIQRFVEIGASSIPISDNSKLKFENRVKFIHPSNPTTGEKWQCLGDAFRTEWQSLNVVLMKQILTELPVLCGSESGPTRGLFTLYLNKKNYKAIGYDFEGSQVKTIFNTDKNASQLLSRHKSCVANDHIEFIKQSKPVLSWEDNPDETTHTKNCLIVFDEINTTTYDLLGGEIEAARSFTQNIVKPIRSQDLELSDGIELPLIVGQKVHSSTVIAQDKDGKDIHIPQGLLSATVLEVHPNLTYRNSYHVIWESRARLNSTRIGYIIYQNKTYPIDLRMGHNSIKAKYNTIALAKLGLDAMVKGSSYNINNMSEEQINDIQSKIEKVTWVRKINNKWVTKTVWAGVLPIQITELASEYCRVKDDHKVLPEVIKYLHHYGYDELALHLMEKEDNKIKKDCVVESIKILQQYNKDIPVFNHEDLLQWMEGIKFPIITFGDKVPNEGLLNFDNNGFIYKHNGLTIRFPSAYMLRLLSDEIYSGEVRYTTIFSRANRLLLSLRGKKTNNQFITNKKQIENAHEAYLDAIKSELIGKNKLISANCTTRIFGLSAKQLYDWRVPRTHVVIFHPTFNKLVIENGLTYHCGTRNPVIWPGQIFIQKIMTADDFEYYLNEIGWNINDVIDKQACASIILRNPLDCLNDQSDCDGDIFPILAPSSIEGQNLLEKIYVTDPDKNLRPYEIDWIKQYTKKELSNSALDFQPFRWYYIDYDKYKQIFADSAIAKTLMGFGTLQLWEWYGLCEWTYGKNYIDKELMHELIFIYARLVQDCLVRGIKHVEGGSKFFTPFILKNILKKENIEYVINTLQKFNLSEEKIKTFLKITKLHETEIGELVSNIVGMTNGYKFNLEALQHQDVHLFFQNQMLSYIKDEMDIINQEA